MTKEEMKAVFEGKWVRFRKERGSGWYEGGVAGYEDNFLKIYHYPNDRYYEIPYSEIDLNDPENSLVRLRTKDEQEYKDQQAAIAKRYESLGGVCGTNDPYAPEPGYGPSW